MTRPRMGALGPVYSGRAGAASPPSGRLEPVAVQPWRPPAVCWR